MRDTLIRRCRDTQVSGRLDIYCIFIGFEHMPATVNSQLKMTFHQPQILKPNQFWTSLKQKGGIRAKIDQWFSKHFKYCRKKKIHKKSKFGKMWVGFGVNVAPPTFWTRKSDCGRRNCQIMTISGNSPIDSNSKLGPGTMSTGIF